MQEERKESEGSEGRKGRNRKKGKKEGMQEERKGRKETLPFSTLSSSAPFSFTLPSSTPFFL
jgi:hypothetical protein